MNNDVSAVFDRSDQIRCTESIINNYRYAVLMCDSRNLIDIRYITVRVSECLEEDSLCIRSDGCFDLCEVVDVNECRFYS